MSHLILQLAFSLSVLLGPGSHPGECPRCDDSSSPGEPSIQNHSRVPPVQGEGHRQAFLEIYTGAWCDLCPDAEVLRDVLTSSRSQFVVVEHHVSFGIQGWDLMALEEVDEVLIEDFSIFGVPTAMLDRNADKLNRNEDWEAALDQRRITPTPVDITFSSSYSPPNRQVSVDVDTKFYSQTAGDLRINCMLAEDPVIGSGSGYDQSNQFDDDSGHPYYQAGNPILNHPHRYVSRVFMDGVYGAPGALPDPALAGQTYSTTLQSTLPVEVDSASSIVLCTVATEGQAAGEREVLDATWAPLGEASPQPPILWDYLEGGDLSRWTSATP